MAEEAEGEEEQRPEKAKAGNSGRETREERLWREEGKSSDDAMKATPHHSTKGWL